MNIEPNAIRRGFIPTYTGDLSDVFVRNSDAIGPIPPYIPFFANYSDARSWCRNPAIDAFPAPCSLSEAQAIAKNLGAELLAGA